MNKTVNINLGGMFFHIDEDAYQKLSRYFEAIKRSISNSNGKDEIMKDIEMRIAEILLEHRNHDNQVVVMRDVEMVIGIMGQPEDYRLEDEEPSSAYSAFGSGKTSKKLYRDEENSNVGGVAMGLSHYLGIDAVWIRIIFIMIAIASFGTGTLIYLILWIVMPVASTTKEKLEMTGEPVNISNIERKVREEFENVTASLKNADLGKAGRRVQNGASQIVNTGVNVVSKLFRILGKIIGAVIASFSALLLVSAIVALLTFGSTTIFSVPLDSYAEVFNYSETSLWLLALCAFLTVSIPLFFFFILGMKLMIDNLRSLGNFTRYTLLAIWLAACVFLIAFAIRQSYEIKEEGKSIRKEVLPLSANDTLEIKFTYNEDYANSIWERKDMSIISDPQGNERIYSTDVHLEFLPTDKDQAYISIEKRARGINMSDARARSEKIDYQYKLEGNQLILDNYFLADKNLKYRKQNVVVYVYLPKGLYIKPDESLRNWDYSDTDFIDMDYSGIHIYKVEPQKVRCVTCKGETNDKGEWEIQVTDSVTQSNRPTATITKTDSIRSNTPLKKLIINKDGIVVKSE